MLRKWHITLCGKEGENPSSVALGTFIRLQRHRSDYKELLLRAEAPYQRKGMRREMRFEEHKCDQNRLHWNNSSGCDSKKADSQRYLGNTIIIGRRRRIGSRSVFTKGRRETRGKENNSIQLQITVTKTGAIINASKYYEDWAGDLLGALTRRNLACNGGGGALLALI